MVISGVVVVKMVCCSGSMLVSCSWYGNLRGGSCENGFVVVGPCWLVIVGMVISGVVVVKMALL